MWFFSDSINVKDNKSMNLAAVEADWDWRRLRLSFKIDKLDFNLRPASEVSLNIINDIQVERPIINDFQKQNSENVSK